MLVIEEGRAFCDSLTSRRPGNPSGEHWCPPRWRDAMSGRKETSGAVELGFERRSLKIPIANLRPLHAITSAIKKSRKYGQIESSIREIGIIEPPVVA